MFDREDWLDRKMSTRDVVCAWIVVVVLIGAIVLIEVVDGASAEGPAAATASEETWTD